MVNARLYLRISFAPDGDLLGVERQEPPCRERATGLGWSVVGTYTDNDVSAYTGERRPEYERLIADTVRDAKAGKETAIVAWSYDRLFRRLVECEQLIDLSERHGVKLATATGPIDLSTSEGRFMFRMMGAASRYESEHKASRQKLKHDQLAKAGLPSGGGRRSVGYEKDGMTIKEDEATRLREAVEKLLHGDSLRGIVLEWNREGFTTPRGRPWNSIMLKEILLRPRLAGFRSHHGKLYPAQWEPIISPETQDELRALLTNPDRQTSPAPKFFARTYLLSNLAYCGREGCGTKLVAHSNRRSHDRSYACLPEKGGCYKLSRRRDPVDEYVGDQVVERLCERLLGPRTSGVLIPAAIEPQLAEQLQKAEAKLTELDEMFAAGETDRKSYLRMKASATDRYADLLNQVAHNKDNWVLLNLPKTPEALRKAWQTEGFDWKRSVVEATVERVVILPRQVKGRTAFEPDLIQISWKPVLQ